MSVQIAGYNRVILVASRYCPLQLQNTVSYLTVWGHHFHFRFRFAARATMHTAPPLRLGLGLFLLISLKS